MFVLITLPFFEIFLDFSFKHLFSNDLDVLLLMLCTFFKGLFALFCHFFKGLLVAKIQNFLLKGKENGNYFFFKRKVFPFSPIIFVFLQHYFFNRRTRFQGDVVL